MVAVAVPVVTVVVWAVVDWEEVMVVKAMAAATAASDWVGVPEVVDLAVGVVATDWAEAAKAAGLAAEASAGDVAETEAEAAHQSGTLQSPSWRLGTHRTASLASH